MSDLINFPRSRFVDKEGFVSREWQQWLLNPHVLQINIGAALGVDSGGTGIITVPGNGKLLIGNGTGYSSANLTASTGITVTNGSGSISVKLSNTTVTAAAYGSASSVGTFAVNGQGQITTAASTAIAISNAQVSGLGTLSTQNANAVAISGGSIACGTFGANGAAAQTAYASGGAVATTAATNIAPYGYTTAAQANAIITLLNNIQTALVNAGIMS